MTQIEQTLEGKRLVEDSNKTKYWKRWGPYLSERQWGTVREDYSAGGSAWDEFSHDQARSRAYRWGEDGIAGISDNHQRLCFALALWNGKDSIIKERIFGLTNSEGNHGEDVKEYYFYLDNTPTHSYMKCLYKYPQTAFPYEQLVKENGRRKTEEPGSLEYELLDTGIFNDDHYFDVFVEYAKNSPEDILIQISVTNRGTEKHQLHVLPTLWFRNTWSWGYPNENKPFLKQIKSDSDLSVVQAFSSDRNFGKRWLYCQGAKEVLYTENETNKARFGWGENSSYVKDGINDYITSCGRNEKAVNPNQEGTKASAHYQLEIDAGETKIVRLRLSDLDDLAAPFDADFEKVFQARKQEADNFYQTVCPFPISEEMRNVQRQAFAGMLWSKQFYHYIVQDWLNGDPVGSQPPSCRKAGRNHEWYHLFNEDILSMPDTWEYPWFAAWDLAFHTIPLALIDPHFAKRQLLLLTQEWFMHPNGQIPAYEWAFGDVNPPVHAWAAWKVYKTEEKMYGHADIDFLGRVFQKLIIYFTWWVNRKDSEGKNIFAGGFLGLDNIGIFDRSAKELPTGGSIQQSDGTSWMGMFSLNMLTIALELAKTNSAYEEIARKFFQHFLCIADVMDLIGGEEVNLWDDQDGFYYDILHLPNDRLIDGKELFSMKLRSMVGLIPLFAIEQIDQQFGNVNSMFNFKAQFLWFLNNRKHLTDHGHINIDLNDEKSTGKNLKVNLSIVDPEKLKLILQKMLDETEFLSPYGIRAISKFHEKNPYILWVNGQQYQVEYEPAESKFALFGGNSNWRGPIWFPVNFLIIESLQKFYDYLGENFKVECPTETGKKMMNLKEVATELSHRLIKIFLKDDSGKRPVYGGTEKFQTDPHWRDLILFYEYFHGDIGAGVGASHQTGWTGLVANLIQQWGEDTALTNK